MDIPQCIAQRNNYSYPPARLVRSPVIGPTVVTWNARHYNRVDPIAGVWRLPGAGYSSIVLDTYHHDLLNSPVPNNNIDGVISAVYWGYFADRDGMFNGYPVARTGWVLAGKGGARPKPPSGIDTIANAVAAARVDVLAGSYGNALRSIEAIRFVGASFASKIVAFLDPDHCGVLDNVIAVRLRGSLDPSLRGIRMTPAGYAAWCNICSNSARLLNLAGATWTDWDGTDHPWRAIDVERVVFAYPGDPALLIL
jgi:hypothetical protein